MLPPEESLGTQKKSQSVKQESLRGQHPDIFTEVYIYCILNLLIIIQLSIVLGT